MLKSMYGMPTHLECILHTADIIHSVTQVIELAYLLKLY